MSRLSARRATRRVTGPSRQCAVRGRCARYGPHGQEEAGCAAPSGGRPHHPCPLHAQDGDSPGGARPRGDGRGRRRGRRRLHPRHRPAPAEGRAQARMGSGGVRPRSRAGHPDGLLVRSRPPAAGGAPDAGPAPPPTNPSTRTPCSPRPASRPATRTPANTSRSCAGPTGVEEATLAPRRGVRAKVLPLPRFIREPIARAFLKAFLDRHGGLFLRPAEAVGHPPATDRRAAWPGHAGHARGTQPGVDRGPRSAVREARSVNIVKLVTIGSPLGLQEVQDYLAVPPRRKPFHVPGSVERWDNFADPLDPVALDKGLAAEFVVSPGQPRHARRWCRSSIGSSSTRNACGFAASIRIRRWATWPIPKVRKSIYEARALRLDGALRGRPRRRRGARRTTPAIRC